MAGVGHRAAEAPALPPLQDPGNWLDLDAGAKGVAGSRWEVEKPWLGGLLILGGGLIDRYIDNIGLILDNIIYLLIS